MDESYSANCATHTTETSEVHALRVANKALLDQVLRSAQHYEAMRSVIEDLHAQLHRTKLRKGERKEEWDNPNFSEHSADTARSRVLVLDNDGRIIKASEPCTSLLGDLSQLDESAVLDDFLSVDEALSLRAALAPSLADAVSPFAERVRVEGKYRAQHHLVTSAGNVLACLLDAVMIRDVQGQQQGFVVNLTDTAVLEQVHQLERYTGELERKVQERTRSMAETEAWFRGIVGAAPTGLIVADEHGEIVLANNSAALMFGYAADELISMNIEQLVPRDVASAHVEMRRRFHEGKIARRLMGETESELRAVRKDGSEFPVEIGLARLQDGGGFGTCFCAAISDISLRAEWQAALINAKQMAEAAATAKSEFLSNMSHEIRTPMNAIIGLVFLALKTDLNPRQRDYLLKVQHSSRQLLGIINDILELSDIESGKTQIEHNPFRLSAVMERVTDTLSDKAKDKGLTLSMDVAGDVPEYLLGDAIRIEQVLDNFGKNAVKFTDAGDIHISVNKQEDFSDGVMLRFTVSDTGIGIRDEDKGKLFQSFSQVDNSNSRKYGGIGLGLAIAKNLSELMGGTVGVESEVGKGSHFWFTVCVGAEAGKRRDVLSPARLSGMRVLVVDDNQYTRRVLCDMLKGMHFLVSSASGGKQALEMLRTAASHQRFFDLVLLDWKMPEQDGIATLKQIQSLYLPQMPHVVMMTLSGGDELVTLAKLASVDDVLIKPIHPQVLLDCALEVIDRKIEISKAASLENIENSLAAVTGARILLVEDNEINQLFASAILGDQGFIVDIADNGKIALEMVQTAAYDLVLMDIQMPVMDGLTATREIRKLPQFSQLPIVALTSNVMPPDHEQIGMNAYVGKPINPDELWQVLLSWIKPRQAGNVISLPHQS